MNSNSPSAHDFDVTAIVVNYNTEKLVADAIAALRLSGAALKLQIIIVDNASRDNSVAVIRETCPDCELIVNSVNVGFGRANNQALPLVRGRYVVLVNTDAFVEADTLPKTLRFMDEHPQCGVLGVKLVGRDGVLQPSCRYFPTPWNEFLLTSGLGRFFPKVRMVDDMDWQHDEVRECDWVPGCYYLVRREAIERVGLFDPIYFLYYEEVDHCRAVKAAGWQVIYYPYTSVVHLGGESAKSDSSLTAAGKQISELQIESHLLYVRKHHGRLGVLASVLLETALEAARALKHGLHNHVDHIRKTWKFLFRTAWGTTPTR